MFDWVLDTPLEFQGSNIALAIRYLKQMGLFPLLSFQLIFLLEFFC